MRMKCFANAWQLWSTIEWLTVIYYRMERFHKGMYIWKVIMYWHPPILGSSVQYRLALYTFAWYSGCGHYRELGGCRHTGSGRNKVNNQCGCMGFWSFRSDFVIACFLPFFVYNVWLLRIWSGASNIRLTWKKRNRKSLIHIFVKFDGRNLKNNKQY